MERVLVKTKSLVYVNISCCLLYSVTVCCVGIHTTYCYSIQPQAGLLLQYLAKSAALIGCYSFHSGE